MTPTRAEEDPDFPLTKYRGAVLMRVRVRKAARCGACPGMIPAKAEAWAPLAENIPRGVHRAKRYHLHHFVPGGEHEQANRVG